MGQYYYVVNVSKRQYLHPHRMGDGLKLMEFGDSSAGTMTGLAILLADGNGRGGGDLYNDHPIIGSWAGDRIVIAGDYADKGTWGVEGPEENLHHYARKHFEEISAGVREALAGDEYIAKEMRKPRGVA